MAFAKARRDGILLRTGTAPAVIEDGRETPLSALEAFLWEHANGQRSAAALTQAARQTLGGDLSTEAIWQGLDSLTDLGLLEARVSPPASEGLPAFSRRQLFERVSTGAVLAAGAFFMSSSSAQAERAKKIDFSHEPETTAGREQVRKHQELETPGGRESRSKRLEPETTAGRESRAKRLEPETTAGREEKRKDVANESVAGREEARKDVPNESLAGREQARKDVPNESLAGREQARKDVPNESLAGREQARKDVRATESLAGREEQVKSQGKRQLLAGRGEQAQKFRG